MNAQELRKAILAMYTKLNYMQFCEYMEFNAEFDERYFVEFQKLAHALATFDDRRLQKILDFESDFSADRMEQKQKDALNVFHYIPVTDHAYWHIALNNATVETLEYALEHADENPRLGKMKVVRIQRELKMRRRRNEQS